MAETESPCRFKSWIKTISPCVTAHSPPRFGGDTVGLEAAISMLASSLVVEIRDGRRRAAATVTSLAEARRRYAGDAFIGVLG